MKWTGMIIACLVSITWWTQAIAQHEHQAATPPASATSTLSADAVGQLLNGDGMGLAKPAELHGYPGPKHVLELRTDLALTADQAQKVEAIRQQMLDEARTLGRSIVDAERALDEAFISGRITDADLAARTAAIAGLQGRLRRAHLQAHLTTKPILTPAQVKKYGELRGAHH